MSDADTKLSSETELADADYRPLSIGSVFVLIAGVISIVAIFSKFLLPIPVATIIFAIVVLVKMNRSQRRVSGVGFATIGISIALLAFSWSLTQELTRNYRLYNQATLCCNRWMALVEDGRLYEAYELTVPYEHRKLEGVDLERIYSSDVDGYSVEEMLEQAESRQSEENGGALAMAIPGSEQLAYDAFYGDEPRATLVAMARNGKLELIKNEFVFSEGLKDEIGQQYLFSYKDADGEQQEIELRFILERWKYPMDGEYHWNITSIEPVKREESL